MWTAEKIEQRFEINKHGIIRDPGKFEGEHYATPYFWDAVPYDAAAWDSDPYAGYYVGVMFARPADARLFDDVEPYDLLLLSSDSRGNVRMSIDKPTDERIAELAEAFEWDAEWIEAKLEQVKNSTGGESDAHVQA